MQSEFNSIKEGFDRRNARRAEAKARIDTLAQDKLTAQANLSSGRDKLAEMEVNETRLREELAVIRGEFETKSKAAHVGLIKGSDLKNLMNYVVFPSSSAAQDTTNRLAVAGVDRDGSINGVAIRDSEYYKVALPEDLLRADIRFPQVRSFINLRPLPFSSTAVTLDWLRARRRATQNLATSLSADYMDATKFIEESTHELNFTLVLSALLTAFVCWFFLGSWGSTINVLLAIPTSIVGSFIVLYFM